MAGEVGLAGLVGGAYIDRCLTVFSTIASLPLAVLDQEGTVLSETDFSEAGCPMFCRLNRHGPGEGEDVRRFELVSDTDDREMGNRTAELPEGTNCKCSKNRGGYSPSLTTAPITLNDTTHGYVVGCQVNGATRTICSRAVEYIADSIAGKAATEIELESLSRKIDEKRAEVGLLQEIAEAVREIFDEKRICQVVLEKAMKLIGVRRASIMVMDEKGEKLRIMAAVGLSQDVIKATEVELGEGISGTVAQTAQPIAIGGADGAPGGLTPRRGGYTSNSFVSYPMTRSTMIAYGKVMGVINMTEKENGQPLTDSDISLINAVASQAATAIYNCRLIEELKETERFERELEIAANIQTNLLPTAPPVSDGFEIGARCVPAHNVGGDYYDFFSDSNGKVSIVIADVSGHNIGAALMAATFRSVIRSQIARNKSPAEVMRATNLPTRSC